MIKLSGSVGRMGVNKKHDVALVQKLFAAIKIKTRFGPKPLWPKKPDGRNSRDLEAAIVCFQEMHGLRATGKLECTAQTMNALTRALPFSMRNQASVQGTSAAVRGPSDPGRESFRIAAETVAKAPFPLGERKTLARAYRSLGPGHNICLSRKKDWVTGDGRFATELEIDGDLSGTLAERNQVHQIICRFITLQGVWEKGNPNDLKFRSKRQLKALKGLGTGPLSTEDKKLLGLTTPPRQPVLLACAKGCARLISSGNIAKSDGKKEAEIIIEAASNADPQLGKLLAQAANEPLFKSDFDPTTIANIQAGFTLLQTRVGSTAQTLNAFDATASRLIEKYFKPFLKGGLENENNPEVIAEIVAIRMERALSFLTGKPLKQIFRHDRHVDVPLEVTGLLNAGPTTIAVHWLGTIYVHEERFNMLNEITRAAILLHEGMHEILLFGKKEDQKYIWQDVTTLGVRDAIKNADSYVAIAFDDVIGQIGQYR